MYGRLTPQEEQMIRQGNVPQKKPIKAGALIKSMLIFAGMFFCMLLIAYLLFLLGSYWNPR